MTEAVPPLQPRQEIPRRRIVLVLAFFYLAFSVVAIGCFTRTSATWDEPQHLFSGYYGLRFGEFRSDPVNLPFAKMWATAPLLAMGDITAPPDLVDQFSHEEWYQQLRWIQAPPRWLYQVNAGDRLLYPARCMIVLFGLGLGTLVFFWVHDWLGYWPAVLAMAGCLLEPNLLAHSTIATTDMALTFFFVATLFCLRLTLNRITVLNVTGLSLSLGAALVTKFSALQLIPIVSIVLSLRALDSSTWTADVAGRRSRLETRLRRMLAVVAIGGYAAMIAYLGIWATYRFRFEPSAKASWLLAFGHEPAYRSAAPLAHFVAEWNNDAHFLPQAYVEGFRAMSALTRGRPSFLMGEYRSTGWWYYFPLAFLTKTSAALLVLTALGLLLALRRWRDSWRDLMLLVVPVCVLGVLAITARINIGIRHILPLYPIAILVAAWAASTVWAQRLPRLLVVLACTCWCFEAAITYPYPLAFFNAFVGGPDNGSRYLSDSNLDWGQDLKGLAAWMRRAQVEQINLAYFGQADPAYYGINHVLLPGSDSVSDSDTFVVRIPGYVAVGSSVQTGAYLPEAIRDWYRPLADLQPVTTIGHTIRVYWIEQPWWPPGKHPGSP